MSLSALAPMLVRDHANAPVRLRPINGANLQHLIEVMDALGRGGVTDVDLVE